MNDPSTTKLDKTAAELGKAASKPGKAATEVGKTAAEAGRGTTEPALLRLLNTPEKRSRSAMPSWPRSTAFSRITASASSAARCCW